MKTQVSSELSKANVDKNSLVYPLCKRTLDIVGALIGIIITLPVQLIIVLFYFGGANKGSIIFKQERYGKHGRVFYIYKFRSMVIDAEKKLLENTELYNKYVVNNYKLEPSEDPRITKFGMFIRKTSLDELPQFINVLKGDMSLVGPRPIVKKELKEYKNRKQELLSVRPGLTGYWQISGRSDVGYPERVDLELYYISNKSFWFDIEILLKTVIQVIFGKGAY